MNPATVEGGNLVDNDIAFSFRFVNEKGELVGRTLKGHFDLETLQLGDQSFRTSELVHARRRRDRLALVVRNANGQAHVTTLAVSTLNVSRLQSWINQAASAQSAQRRKELLESSGDASSFATEACPKCYSTIDLSRMPRSDQTFCRFCETIWSRTDSPTDEKMFRLCDGCGYFAQPQEYTSMIFAVHSIHWNAKYACNPCMRRDAWIAAVVNFFTIFLFIPSCVLLFRSYFGGSARSRNFKGLDSANTRAKNRDTAVAVERYKKIEERLGRCAGVRYNHGLAYLQVGRFEEATVEFQKALLDCANYFPAYDKLCRCYATLGRPDAMQKLHEIWGNTHMF